MDKTIRSRKLYFVCGHLDFRRLGDRRVSALLFSKSNHELFIYVTLSALYNQICQPRRFSYLGTRLARSCPRCRISPGQPPLARASATSCAHAQRRSAMLSTRLLCNTSNTSPNSLPCWSWPLVLKRPRMQDRPSTPHCCVLHKLAMSFCMLPTYPCPDTPALQLLVTLAS